MKALCAFFLFAGCIETQPQGESFYCYNSSYIKRLDFTRECMAIVRNHDQAGNYLSKCTRLAKNLYCVRVV
jgi:hypothetical protein